jgi:hypothetical protein
MNKKTTITNLVGMKQEVTFTEVEELLISVIDNFILWYTTESDRKMAEEYIVSEHINYNEWFKINKSKYNKENKMKVKELIKQLEKCPQDLPIICDDKWIYKIEVSETGESGYECCGEIRLIKGE